MIHSGFCNKIVIPVIGLVMGIVLFLVSFTMIFDSILFNSAFQDKAFSNIGFYNHAAEIAGTLSSGISVSETETESVTDIKPIFNSADSPDLISKNIKSVTDGLISYFRGYTDQLPDLHLTADNDSVKVNLSIIFMIFGEFNITDVLLVISLLQFVLKYISVFGMILFLTIFYIILNTDKKSFYACLKITAAISFILCLTAGILILLGLKNVLPGILAQTDRFEAISSEVMKEYISYFANTLSAQLILLGTTIFAVVWMVLFLFERLCTAGFCIPLPNRTAAAAVLLLSALLSSVIFYTQIKSAHQNFADRNLSRAVSFINGRVQYYQITDARNDPVYLLDVKVLDSITKLPVPNLSAYVSVSGENGIWFNHSYTDSDGVAAFLLDKGHFSLELDSGGILADYNPPGLLSFEFDMAMPGKSELVILLDKQTYGMMSVKKAVLQYIP
ncbi:MAG: hypothetical protein ABFD25_00030 [Clostridiaceae bacterium]